MENLEWRGYPTVKKFVDMITRFDATHERDRQTDGHRTTVHCIASRGNSGSVRPTEAGVCADSMPGGLAQVAD